MKATRTILTTSNDDTEIVVDKKEVYKCTLTDTWLTILLVKSGELSESSLNLNDFKDLEEDEAIALLDDNYISYIKTGTSDTLVEPKPDEYIVVWSGDENVSIGDDPYMWDYELYGYTYWDGSNHKELLFDYSEDVTFIVGETFRDPQRNYGRGLTYNLYKKEDSEFAIGFQNEGYAEPETVIETETFKGLPMYSEEGEVILFIKKEVMRFDSLEEIQSQLNEIMQFAGIMSGESKNMSSGEIKASKIKKYTFDDK